MLNNENGNLKSDLTTSTKLHPNMNERVFYVPFNALLQVISGQQPPKE